MGPKHEGVRPAQPGQVLAGFPRHAAGDRPRVLLPRELGSGLGVGEYRGGCRDARRVVQRVCRVAMTGWRTLRLGGRGDSRVPSSRARCGRPPRLCHCAPVGVAIVESGPGRRALAETARARPGTGYSDRDLAGAARRGRLSSRPYRGQPWRTRRCDGRAGRRAAAGPPRGARARACERCPGGPRRRADPSERPQRPTVIAFLRMTFQRRHRHGGDLSLCSRGVRSRTELVPTVLSGGPPE